MSCPLPNLVCLYWLCLQGSDPARREEITEQKQGAMIRLEQVKRREVGPEIIKMQALIQRCNAELEEMTLVEQYRKDESYDPILDVERHS